jgi:hypothetical protein
METANIVPKFLIAVVLATAAVPASALQPNPRVAEEARPKIMVPTPTPAANEVSGCWTADRRLYGYQLSFCVNPGDGGSYTVTGKGLHCHARLGWQQTWGGYGFAMSRTSCGHGMDWTADTFTCVLKHAWDSDRMGRMPVPSQGSHLDCNYRPSVWGYQPARFSAHRT